MRKITLLHKYEFILKTHVPTIGRDREGKDTTAVSLGTDFDKKSE